MERRAGINRPSAYRKRRRKRRRRSFTLLLPYSTDESFKSE
jgi:hypothetical protein